MQAHSQEEMLMEKNHDGLNSNPGKACGCVVVWLPKPNVGRVKQRDEGGNDMRAETITTRYLASVQYKIREDYLS